MAIHTEMEIAAPPSKVREILLDFSKYPEWHTTFFKSISPEDNSKSLQPGDKLKCNADGMEFVVSITANSESLFQWQGPPVYGVAGVHSFHFEPANDEGTATVFRQSEKFTGLIAFLVTPSLLGRGLWGHFNRFYSDLKDRAES